MREFLYFRHMVFDPVEITNVEFIYIFVLSRLTRSPFFVQKKNMHVLLDPPKTEMCY